MSYNVFLDDVRVPDQVTWKKLPKYEWNIVRTYNQFINLVKNKGLPNYICYDHDLGDEHYGDTNIDYSKYKEKTGYDCAKWMIEYCESNKLKHPNYIIHSMSPIGSKNIETLIENYNNNFKY